MTKEQTLAQLRRDFTYLADGRLDAWRIHGPGPVVGDCEDFALTLAWRLAGESWWRFLWHLVILKSVVWYGTSPRGAGHAMLWHRGAGWSCNIFPAWAPDTGNRKRFPGPFPLVLFKLALAAISAWADSTVKRAKGRGDMQ